MTISSLGNLETVRRCVLSSPGLEERALVLAEIVPDVENRSVHRTGPGVCWFKTDQGRIFGEKNLGFSFMFSNLK